MHRGLKKKLTSINEEDFDTIQGDISASMQLKLENLIRESLNVLDAKRQQETELWRSSMVSTGLLKRSNSYTLLESKQASRRESFISSQISDGVVKTSDLPSGLD